MKVFLKNDKKKTWIASPNFLSIRKMNKITAQRKSEISDSIIAVHSIIALRY